MVAPTYSSLCWVMGGYGPTKFCCADRSSKKTLKIIHETKIHELSSRKRFEIEGRVIAKLDYPNLVKIYNMGLDQGTYPFYVMDLLPGKALSDYINQDNGLTFEQCFGYFSTSGSGPCLFS